MRRGSVAATERDMMMTRLTVLVLAAFAVVAVTAQPGRLPATKKLIEYGWDVPNPDFVAANITEMEKRPFDGLILRPKASPSGQVFAGGKWKAETFEADMAALKSVKWGKFKHNFLIMYAASEQDWFSDEDWANVLSNVNLMAQLAKAGRCDLAFDAEPYGMNPWSYAEQKHAKEKTYAEYAAKARQRGGQFIEAIGKVIPDNVLLTFFTFSMFAGMADIPDPAKREDALKQHGYGLYYPFLLGVLDKIGPRMSITDGNEPSYYYPYAESYLSAYHMMRQQALGLIPPELVSKFQTNTQASQALYMDYVFARVDWPNIPSKFMTPEDQAKWFESDVYWALKTTDEYVWCYSEKMNWWTNTDVPAGMEQAIVNAREDIASNRPPRVDMREQMKAIDERRKAEIDKNLLRRSAEIPVLRGAPVPVVDGKLDDAAWSHAATLEPFVGYFGTKPEALKAHTHAMATYDAAALYIAVHAEEPMPEKMQLVGANHDDAVWNGDSLDVFLTQEPSGLPYDHFILSPKNVQWDALFSDAGNDMSFDPKWQSATQIGKQDWTAEIAFPWKDLKISPAPGLKLRANLCRQRRAENEQSCWSQTVSGFMEDDHFGTWVLR